MEKNMNLVKIVTLLAITVFFSVPSYSTPICQFEEITSAEESQIYNGCDGKSCPVLECRHIPSMTYAKVRGGFFRYAYINQIGYGVNLTKLLNSDFREATIEILGASNLSGSDLRDASIMQIESELGTVDLSGADLRGTIIFKVDNLDNINFSGAIYDSSSIFAFSEAVAIKKGMIKK